MQDEGRTGVANAPADVDGLTIPQVKAWADRIVAAHRGAPPVAGEADGLETVAAATIAAMRAMPFAIADGMASSLERRIADSLRRTAPIRQRRAATGYRRHCEAAHMPASDTMRHLAQALMQLESRQRRPLANVLLGQYLWHTGDESDLDALMALPLYLGLCVSADALEALGLEHNNGGRLVTSREQVVAGLSRASAYLAPPPACLVAIGGMSGTGKSTLAAMLAPRLGAAPGAVHIRTDLERKWLAGTDETTRLPPSAYDEATTRATYARVASRARAALLAGHCVVIDATFVHAADRRAIAALARDAGVPFHGLWLTAPASTLRSRVAARSHDASDATVAVVDRQLASAPLVSDWTVIAADGSPDTVALMALKHLSLLP